MTELRRNPRRTTRVLLAVALLGGITAAAHVEPTSAAGRVTECTLASQNSPTTPGQAARFRFFANNDFERGGVPPFGPTGTVTFFADLNPVPFALAVPLIPDGGPTIDHSSVVVETSSLSPGTHTIRAVFVPLLASIPFLCPGGNPEATHVVRSTASVTSVTSSVNPTVWTQSTTFAASVTKVGGGSVAGSVDFVVDGTSIGVRPVDGSGNAAIDVATLSVGNHVVTAQFVSSDAGTQNSSATLNGGQTVNQAATSTVLSSSVNPTEIGVATTFTATVAAVAPATGVPAGSFVFRSDGSDITGSIGVDGSGRATVTTSSLAIGDRAITAAFSPADPGFLPSGAALTQTVEPARTALEYTGATSGDFHDPATVSARLTRSRDGAAISDSAIRFTIASRSCDAMTDSDGRASCVIVVADPAGPNTVQASFAGDPQRRSSSDTRPFTITREQTAIIDTGDSVLLNGATLRAAATLREDDGAPVLAGRVINFSVGSGAARQTCSAPTDATGRAACTIASTSQPLGAVPMVASFDQDAYYEASSATRSIIVYAFPAFGAFVIGDRVATLSNRVTFYNSDWSERNGTTGGEAPDSFKGFAATPGPLPQCGGLFGATPGRSTKPPSTLPSYMGTIVTSKVKKNGSSITGTRVSLVVVQVDRQSARRGESDDVIGTGVVVATIPC